MVAVPSPSSSASVAETVTTARPPRRQGVAQRASVARKPRIRIGCSMKRYEMDAAANVTTAATAPTTHGSAGPLRYGASASVSSTHTGQCQR